MMILPQIAALSVLASLSVAAPLAHAGPGNDNAPKGGVFYLNLGGEPTTLNPITSTDLYAQNVQGYVIDALATRNDDTYEWEPALATSWEISKDGKQFTFKLRQGVKFHDGKPVTADDVKFSFDVIFNPKFPTAHLRPYYEGIEKVEIVDPQTVRFTAKDKYFRNFDSAAGLSVVPKHVYSDPAKGPKLNRELTGTGPYRLDKYERGKRIVLKRNPDWWGNAAGGFYKGQYNFDQIVLRFVKENTVALEMLKKGELDYEAMTPEIFTEKAKGPEWGKTVFKVKTENFAPKGFGFVGWNLKDPKFQDKKVRVALAHLMNRKAMIEKFRYGMSLPATGPWYQQSDYASKKVKALEYDPKKALALLREAGWSDSDKDGVVDKVIDGKKVSMRFTLMTANQDFMKYLTMYKQDAQQAGVDMQIKYVEWNSFSKLIDEYKFDAVNLGWGGGAVDLDPKQLWHSASAVPGGSNFVSYKNPEVDKLIDQARVTMDKKERIPMLQKVYEMIADDAPYAFMFNDKNVLYGHTGKMQRPKDTFKYSIGTSYWWVKQ